MGTLTQTIYPTVEKLVRFGPRLKCDELDRNDVWRITKVKRVNVDVESTTRPGKKYVVNIAALVEATELDKELAPPPPPYVPPTLLNPGALVKVPSLSKKGYYANQDFVVISDRGTDRVKVAKLGGESRGRTWSCPREGVQAVES